MKNIYKLIPVLLLSIVLTGCNNWLNVTPDDEITEKDLFKSGNGFRAALNGLYKTLGSESLYGKQLSWGIVDAMGQMYALDYGRLHELYQASNFGYEGNYLKPHITKIWEESYNVVANCNNIIENISDVSGELFEFKEKERSFIQGEALAIRAFVHFDMLRLFAPAPITNPTGKYIPYVTSYPLKFTTKLSVNECLDSIIVDLKKAKEILSDFESDGNNLNLVGTGNRFTAPTASIFVYFRGYRFNYYAISAVLARVYLYAGHYDEALKEANVIIEFQNEMNYYPFSAEPTSSNNGDVKLYNDVISALHVPKITEWYQNTISEDESGEHTDYLRLLNINGLFSDSEKANDYRYKYQIEQVGSNYRSIKNYNTGTTYSAAKICNIMSPVVRMSEVYFIASECEFIKNNYSVATEYLEKIRNGRRRSNFVDFEEITNKDTFYDMLLEEARKEFVQEGQIFFMHKRLNMGMKGDGVDILPGDHYVLPLPDSEIVI